MGFRAVSDNKQKLYPLMLGTRDGWATKRTKGAKLRALLRLNPYVKFMRGQLVRSQARSLGTVVAWRVDRGEIGVELSLCKLPTKL